MQSLIIHTASLYYWFSPYESTLDDRIHAALDASLDGVEISNGPALIEWRPCRDTIRRLRGKTVTIHAELSPDVTLDTLRRAIARLPFAVANVVFHPNELTPTELIELSAMPFWTSLENMDPTKDGWHTADELKRAMWPSVGFTLDTAHAEDHGLPVSHFRPLFTPAETHLSISNDNYYDFDTAHAMTHLRPNDFPHVPSGCPIVTLEGVVPASIDVLDREVEFVRSRLC